MATSWPLPSYARQEFENEDEPAPHAQQHRQWWETHTAIVVLLLLAVFGALAATGLSAGYGYTILNKLHHCCATINNSLGEIKDTIAACCATLAALIGDFRSESSANFATVVANEETIIALLESPPAWGWQCATGYALPAPNCIELTQAMLPLVVPQTAAGACYAMQSNLVWNGPSPNSYAIDWFGGGGALYGCGHTLTVTQPAGRAIHVSGSQTAPGLYGSIGDLAVYDLTLLGPTNFYNNANRGVYSFHGARTRLYNVNTYNFHYGSFALEASLEEYDCNHTVRADSASVARASGYLDGSWDGSHVASRCQSSICRYVDVVGDYTVKPLPGGVIDYSVVPFYDYFIGIWAGYNPLLVGDIEYGQPTAIHVERCDMVGTEPYWFEGVGRGFLAQSTARIAPAFAPADLMFPNSLQQSFGVRFGGEESSNVVVDGLTVDARRVNEWVGDAYVVSLVGTEGVTIRNTNVYGRMPITQWMLENYPHSDRRGLIAVEPLPETRGFEPAQLINVNVKADDAETIGMTVYLSADTLTHPGHCYGARGTIRVDGCSFVDGAAGIVVGSQQQHLLSVSNSLFEGAYYGVYAFNESSNVVLKNNDFARSCVAVEIEAQAGNYIVRENSFTGNHYDIDDNSGVAVIVGALSAGTLFTPCNATATPFIWDHSLLVPCNVSSIGASTAVFTEDMYTRRRLGADAE